MQDFARLLEPTGEGREVEPVLASANGSVQAFMSRVSEGWSSSASIGYN